MRHTAMVVLVGLMAATGCDLFNNALEVQTPSNVPASGLEVPGNAGLLVNSAIGDFECAAGAYAAMSGLIGTTSGRSWPRPCPETTTSGKLC